MDCAITMRLYCHGLGDCLLLKLRKSDGSPFWMLIDCGIHSSSKGGTALVREVVEDILSCTDRLDVVVGTHEHWDHISGFDQAEDLFARLEVGEVWFAWTENPEDPLAQAFDKFKGDALAALTGSALALAEPGANPAAAERLDSLFGFVFGAAGEKSRDAREKLRALSASVRHLEPGSLVPLPPELDQFRIYVLGPSRDTKLFGLMDSVSDTYNVAPQSANLVQSLANGLAIADGSLTPSADPLAPFDSSVGLPLSDALDGNHDPSDPDVAFLDRHYAGPASVSERLPPRYREGADQTWRRIDADWLGSASELAMQLDSRTNNTSLVLAIELPSGKVLFFAADAQIGNWKGWAETSFAREGAGTVSAADLLARTVFYKVGHHGSRNATRGPGGLEAMTSPDLTAFIPTDQVMAKKVGWSDIPARQLLMRLQEKTKGRIVQSDEAWIQAGAPAPGGGQAQWFSSIKLGKSKVDPGRGLYVELSIE